MKIGSFASRRIIFALCTFVAALPLLLLSGCSKEPSGKYEYSDSGVTTTIEFKADHKFTITTSAAIVGSASNDGDYTMKDDKVSLKVKDSPEAFELTKNGDALEGNFMGHTVKFVKK